MLRIICETIQALCGIVLLPLLGPMQPHPLTTLLAAQPSGCGVCYFVDAQLGDDSYSGRLMEPDPARKDGPVKTIQLAYDRLQPGDTLYIKKGLYRQALNLTKTAYQFRPIMIQALPGDQGDVIITGADPVIAWHRCPDAQSCAGNPYWQQIFYAQVDKDVRQVFQGDKRLRPSRYPVEGWLYPASVPADNQIGFYDPAIAAIKDIASTGICNIRTAPWHIDQIRIQSYSAYNAKLTLLAPTRYPISLSSGYYLTNLVSQIRQEGQWAFDYTRGRLYIWPIGGSPNDVEVTVRDYGIAAAPGTSYHTISGLSINSANDGIRLEGTSHMYIVANSIDWSSNAAILDSGTSFSTISENTIRYSGYSGILQDQSATNGLIEGNLVYATGAQEAGEDPINGDAIGMAIFGTGTRVIGNRIDRTSYDGLYVGRGDTSGREVAYNHITNACLSLADGAGIYTDGHSNLPLADHIHHNIVADTWGWLGGWARKEGQGKAGSYLCVGEGYGIYLDEQANNRVVEHNTILYCSAAGIFVHWAQDNIVSSNTAYGNGACQILLAGRDDPRFGLKGNSIYGNLMIATRSYQSTLSVHIDYSNIDLSTCDQNRYYHPTDARHIAMCSKPSSACSAMSLAQWQATTGNDAASVELWSTADHTSKEPSIMANPSMATITIPIVGQYLDPDGILVKDSVALGPFESIVLLPLSAD